MPAIGSRKKQMATYGPQIKAPAAQYPTDNDGNAGDRERAGCHLKRNAAIGEERDDVHDGSVDRQNAEKERDRQHPEGCGFQRRRGVDAR
jgi:hypothetical protein